MRCESRIAMPTTSAALCRCSGLAILTLLLLRPRPTVAPRPLAARRRDAQPPHLGRADRLAAIAKGAPDVAAYLPLRFEAKFSSPCWRNGSALRCLPRLFLAGAMQCGVPDLWERLRAHALLGALRYDAQAHWWTNHPRSRAGYFERYVSLYSGERTAAALEAEPRSVLADASPASFTFMMAEELRLHYLYLDAFDNCYRRCRNQKLPEAVAAKCAVPPPPPASSADVAPLDPLVAHDAPFPANCESAEEEDGPGGLQAVCATLRAGGADPKTREVCAHLDRGVVGVELGTAVGREDGTAVANVGTAVANVGAGDTEPAAQVAVIACAAHDESPSNSQLVDTAAAARSPSGSTRRYSSKKVEPPPHSSQAISSSAELPSPTYIRRCHASSADEYQT